MIEDAPILTLNETFTRPDQAALDALKGAPTGVIADCLGGGGALHHAIKPIGTNSPVFTATAVTCACGPADNLAAFAALALCQPGDAIIASADGFEHAAVIGDLYAGMAANAGVVAFVTDGAVRDVPGINGVDIACFATVVTPNSPAKNGPGTAGLPIVMGGQTIASGDVVVGDVDGVVIIPQARLAHVLAELPKVLEAERALEDKVKAGLVLPDWCKDLLAGPRTKRVG